MAPEKYWPSGLTANATSINPKTLCDAVPNRCPTGAKDEANESYLRHRKTRPQSYLNIQGRPGNISWGTLRQNDELERLLLHE